MTATFDTALPRRPRNYGKLLRTMLPALSMTLILIAIAWLNPRALISRKGG